MEYKKIETLQKCFLVLDRLMGNHARSEAGCCGVTLPQCHALFEIGLAGKTTLKDLSALLDLDKSTLSRTIDGLVDEGFVDRAPDREDRRYVVLSLTKKGMSVFERINTIWFQFCTGMLKNIPVKKHDQVLESMALIIEALQMNDLGKKSLRACIKS